MRLSVWFATCLLLVSTASSQSCPHPTKWCHAEKKCFDLNTEPCNNQCLKPWFVRYCFETNTCIKYDRPCGTQCEEDRYYCEEDNTCKSGFSSCSGKCRNERRFCPLYGGCLTDDYPCGQSCPRGRRFCFVSNECLPDSEK